MKCLRDTQTIEMTIVCVSRRHFILRHHALAIFEFKIAPIRDLKRVADGFRRVILKCLPHLVNTFKIEMIIEPQSVLLFDSFFRLDTEEHIVHFVIGFAEVVAIVCSDEREIEFFRQLDHHWIGFKLLVYIVILHLNIEVVLSHYLHQRFEILDPFFAPIGAEELWYLSLNTSRQCDNPVPVLT